MNAVKEQLVRSTHRLSSLQDFRSLEVRDREASIELIRAAAVRQVRRSRRMADSLMYDDANSHVASILASAYRLLDPRRRTTRSERVNLSPLFVRDENETDSTFANPLISFDATVDMENDEIKSADLPQVVSSDPSISELRDMLAILRANA